MKWQWVVLVLPLLGCVKTATEPKFAIRDEPIMGSFAVTWEPGDVRQALDTGINLFFCYDRRAGGRLLDPENEMGAMIRQAGAKVMYNLCFAGGFYLAEDVSPDATEIQLAQVVSMRDPGVFWIGDEAVRYEKCVKGRLIGCKRGWQNTKPAPHPRGEYVIREAILRKALLAVKDSPNLWGFWIMDDRKGNQRNALRNMYRLIKKWDVDENGKPNSHVVVAGMSNTRALTNFDAGVCDMIGVYIYPGHRCVYKTWETADELTRMLPIVEERSPGTPFMGIYQAFTGPRYNPKPSALQLRKQILDFAHFGASAYMAYSWRMIPDKTSGKERGTLRNLPDLREEVKRVVQDLRTGAIPVGRPRPDVTERKLGTPDLTTLTPLLVCADLDKAPQARPGVTDELASGPDGSRWLHMRFDQYKKGGSEWPSIRLGKELLRNPGNVPTAGWLVADVHNYEKADSEIGFTLRDSRQKPWWSQYFPLPANTTTKLYAPLSEMRGIFDVSDLSLITVLKRRPPVPTHLALRGLYLAPLQTASVPGAQWPCVTGSPTIDGNPDDPCWEKAKPVTLQDSRLSLPPIRPVSVRIAAHNGMLSLRVTSDVSGDPPRCSQDQTSTHWTVTDDTVEVLLTARDGRSHSRSLHDARGRMQCYTKGPDRPGEKTRAASTVRDGQWQLEIAIDTRPFASAGREFGLSVRRHDMQTGTLIWPKDLTVPIGVEAVGKLVLPAD